MVQLKLTKRNVTGDKMVWCRIHIHPHFTVQDFHRHTWLNLVYYICHIQAIYAQQSLFKYQGGKLACRPKFDSIQCILFNGNAYKAINYEWLEWTLPINNDIYTTTTTTIPFIQLSMQIFYICKKSSPYKMRTKKFAMQYQIFVHVRLYYIIYRWYGFYYTTTLCVYK